MYIKARTGWNEPLFKEFIVRQKSCNLQTLTLTKSVTPIILATASGVSSLKAAETGGEVANLYTNTEPFLCADYEYDFVDLNGKALAADFKAKLSVAGGKIYFD